ncbi:hypothetical protein BDY24DRAFT_438627 [Mrakia frigida]|uniref:uncharacterized protein n=1 Tax=Mrakia frigida TaxID=29902 RepID=UPI003FCC152A
MSTSKGPVELTDAVSFLLSQPDSNNDDDDEQEDGDFSFQSEDHTYSEDEDEEEEEEEEEDELPKPVEVWRRIPASNPEAPMFHTFALDPTAQETREDDAYIVRRRREMEEEYAGKLGRDEQGKRESDGDGEGFEGGEEESLDGGTDEGGNGDGGMEDADMEDEVEGLREERLERMVSRGTFSVSSGKEG